MRGIEHLHPAVRAKAEELQSLCASKNIPLLITDTFRTVAEQDALYAQGRTTPGGIVTNCKGNSYQSPHQWGVAFDFCRNIKGKEYDDSDGFFKTVGNLAKTIGICWGGDWTGFVDKPHLELDSFLPNHSTSTLKTKYGSPDNFKATWGETSSRPILQKGSTGEAVKTLQNALNTHGTVPVLVVDGSFGVATENAVKAFQASKKLAADGVVGSATWAELTKTPAIPTRADYQTIIQAKCGFSDPQGVWACFDSHKYADVLYARLAGAMQ